MRVPTNPMILTAEISIEPATDSVLRLLAPHSREAPMTISPVLAWYDLWIGIYWDRTHHRLYVLPLPCVGVCFDFGGPNEDE